MLLKGTIRIEGSFRPPSLAHIHCKEVQIEIEKVNRERKQAVEEELQRSERTQE